MTIRPSLLLPLALLSGCAVTGSLGGDLARIRELARMPVLPAVGGADVEPVPTQQPRELLRAPLNGDVALRIALLNNRELRAQLQELGIARGRLMQAGLLPNPVIETELLPRDTSLQLRVEYDLTSLLLRRR